MSDRELLGLAAKAAGLRINQAFQAQRDAVVDPAKASLWIDDGSTAWNPLTDDGHALRLAVKLDLTIFGPGSRPGVLVKTAEAHTTYSDDCVRRAIVLAAAAIGQAMQEKH